MWPVISLKEINTGPGGDFPKSVKDRFTLVVRELKIGSVGATLGIADAQQGLFPQMPTMGEKAIELTNEIVHIAQSDNGISEKIAEIIPDEQRAYRLIQEIDNLWPDNRPFSVRSVLASLDQFSSILHANRLSNRHFAKNRRQLKKRSSAG